MIYRRFNNKTHKSCELKDLVKDYVILDLETTGLSPISDTILEIGALKVIDNKVVDEFQTLVNPKRIIDSRITSINGINNRMVSNAPFLSEILPDFLDFTADMPVMAHNAGFDLGFIYHNSLTLLSTEFTNGYIDTLALARKIYPSLYSHKLSSLVSYLGLKGNPEHRAISDCYCVFELYKRLLDKIGMQ